MAFDTKKFMSEKFTARTAGVSVTDMAAWFEGDDPPIWKVRGLTGKEVGFAREAVARNKSIPKIQEMLTSTKVAEKLEALTSLFNLDSKKTPDAVALALDYFRLGSVEPECTLELAVKVCKTFPIEFDLISRKIQELTGLGMQPPGKLKKSGKKRT